MRVLRMVVALGMVVVLALPAAAAGEITMSNSGFSPARVTRVAGGSVTWHKTSGYHNVMSTQGMFTSGAPQNSEFTYTRTFSAGKYPYICAVHPQSMRGVVRVRPKVAQAPAGRPFTVTWATAATNTGSRFTVQYRVGGGTWKKWTTTSATSRVFGSGGQPVRVKPGTTYSFRVRSRSGDNASGFSPPKSFRL